VLGSAADGAVASRHADHGADELQAQRRAIRTAKDHISIEGGVLIGAPEVLRKPRFTCSRPAIHSTVIA
jgi:hypothetical protein